MDKKKGLEIVKRLVEQFGQGYDQFTKATSEYNEMRLRNDFLDPFLKALGWDVSNEKGLSQYLREVILEDSVEVEGEEALLRKKPDYALRVAGERKFFVEAKKPAVPVITAKEPAFQLRRYGWNAKVPVSVLSNFDKLVIYDCRPRPKADDDPRIARMKIYSYTDYIDKFDEIYGLLSSESVCSGQFDQTFAGEKEPVGTEPFDRYFLQQIEKWRSELAQNIFELNPSVTEEDLNFLIQRLINRIIFVRICEDRETEKYKGLKEITSYTDLKALFVQADKRYDSSLFDFIEDQLSLNIKIDDQLLIKIFQELYYPESPYAFSVVETNLLGQIYEHFLAHRIYIDDKGNIKIAEKPEVVAANGVVSTPGYIVDNIIKRAMVPLYEGKSPEQLAKFKVADIACGSGVFLLTAYENLLNYHLDWYLRDGADKHKDKLLFKRNRWQLTLEEKQRILLNNIWGVDIDQQAVEVSRFSLLLRVVEGETSATIGAHLKTHTKGALPNLNGNIQCGNSLVDNAYFEYAPEASASQETFNTIKPFDWASHFPQIMKTGGFDVIVGNPPYIRIQNMVKYSPEEIRYYQSSESPFCSAKSDNFDKYSLFIERAISLLKPQGRLGYIVPHKFFKIKSGSALRDFIASGRHLLEIVYFGVQQVFGKARSTYTCILVLSKQAWEAFTVEHVNNLGAWRYGTTGSTDKYPAENISEKPWVFVHPKVKEIFDRVKNQPHKPLSAVADIFVGVQTSADKIYIVKSIEENETTITFIDRIDKKTPRTVEKAILRPCLIDASLTGFGRPEANGFIIFPYKIENDRAILYSQKEMSEKFPFCWKYLNEYKEALSKRDMNGNGDNWYQYGRSQSLTKFSGKAKLIWPVLSLVPRYTYDDRNIIITGGGNGPYYALRPIATTALSIFYIQAILSHPIIESMVQAGASIFRGGYGSHGKQFIANLPIREIDFEVKEQKTIYDRIVKLVKELVKVTEQWSIASIPSKKDRLSDQRSVLIKQINDDIEALYGLTPADIDTLKAFPVGSGETEEDLKS